jgi:hypothetical protein
VGHLGDHSRNQRRFAPMVPHIIGIGAPFHRNTQSTSIGVSRYCSMASWHLSPTRLNHRLTPSFHMKLLACLV